MEITTTCKHSVTVLAIVKVLVMVMVVVIVIVVGTMVVAARRIILPVSPPAARCLHFTAAQPFFIGCRVWGLGVEALEV